MFYQDLLPRKERQAAAPHRQPVVRHDGKQGGTTGDRALLFLGPYPVTSALLWVVHLLYFVQWRKSRRRRRRNSRSGRSLSRITYRTIVEKKHFYKWWAALLVQYHPSRTGDADVGSNLAVDMGHADEDTTTRSSTGAAAGDLQHFRRWIERQSQTVIARIPESWRESRAAARLMHGTSLALVGIQRGVAWAGGKAVILLLYNTHLLWSCRALEMHYGSISSSSSAYSHFSYLRLWVSVGLWETLLELLVSAYLLRALGPNNNPAPPPPAATDTPLAETLLSVEHEPNGDSPLLRRIRKKIRGRTMGASLSMMCAALLMIFRIQFPYVSVPILPWIPISRWFHLSPFVSHLMALLLLHQTSVAATGDSATSWVALGCGGFVGMLWGTGWLDFCSDAYWGNGVLVLAFLLTALSLKARNPRMSLLLWIDWVGWNERGNMLFYDTNVDRWVEILEERLPTVVEPEESDSESEDSMSDDDDSDRAFPTADDNEIYGRLPALSSMEMGQLGEENDGSDGEGETSQLIPSSPTGSSRNTSRFRSRRTGSTPSDPESRER